MRSKIFSRILIFVMFLTSLVTINVFADSTVDNYNNYAYPMSIYKKAVIQPFSLESVGQNESIDPTNGNLEIRQTDLSLKGKNGLDFNLTRMYSASDAKLYEPKCIDKPYNTFWVQGYYISGTETKEKYVNDVLSSSTSRNVAFCFGNPYEEMPIDWQFFRNSTYWSTSRQAQKMADNFNSGVYDISSDPYLSGNDTIMEVTKYSDKEDFIVNIRYQLTEAGAAIVIPEQYRNSTTTTVNDRYFNLGTGWSFDMPYIETRGLQDKYLHLPSRGTIHFTWNDLTWAQVGGQLPIGYDYNFNVTLDNYSFSDLKLTYLIYKNTTPYSNSNGVAKYILSEKDGRNMYFGSDGRLLGIKDRFGNEIKYLHNTSMTGALLVTQIIDSVDRKININYETSRVVVEVVDDVDSSNNRKIYYNKTKCLSDSTKYLLDNVVDAENRVTKYSYEEKPVNFSFRKKDPFNASADPVVTINSECLKKITYPTGGSTEYNYNDGKYSYQNLGNSGFIQFYKIVDRAEYKKDGTKYNYKNYKYYNYFNGDGKIEYDGYPNFSGTSLSNEVTVNTDVTDDGGNKESYTYTYIQNPSTKYSNLLNTEILSEGKNNKNQILKTYDLYTKLLTKSENKVYNKSTGTYIDQIQNYQYDSDNYKDLISCWDVQADRDSNNIPINDEHKVSYKYDPTYHYVTEKTYKKDSSTTIKEEYTPTPDYKSIEYARVYENGVKKAQTQFLYDAYGNAIEERQYKRNAQGLWSDYVSVKYDYNDNDTSRISVGKAINGAYLTKKSVENIKDVDGNLIVSKNGNSQGTIDEVYKYDYLGNLKDKQDGNGNQTKYDYDNLSRIIKETNPDGTFKSFVYDEYKVGDTVTANDDKNSVEVTDEQGNKIKVIYDELGNLKCEQDATSGENIKQYQYDESFRLKKEISNRGKDQNKGSIVEYEYYSDGRLKKKEVKEIENFSSLTNFDNLVGKVLSCEIYEYEDSDGTGQYSKIIKTIKGDANSPDIKMATYTDKAGRLRLQERNHGTKIYKDTFEYDYLGNKTEEKIARAYDEALTQSYTSKYEYDFAGRVIKQYNINGEYITTAYNDLGRVKSETDIKGNKAAVKYSTSIEYDDLGRKIKEVIPFENKNGTIYYSINKYHYDANGNLIKDMVTKNKPGEAEAYNETSYEYNNRNFLTKVITYDEGNPENYTQFYYDKAGNKLRMYNALSEPLTINGLDNVQATGDSTYSVTKYDYDRFGRLLSKIDPLGKLESYQYDLLGNVVKKTDRNKNIIDMTYDGLNRVLVAKVTTLDGKGNTATSYGYTLTGQRKTMASGGVTTTNYYDDLGRLKLEQDTTGITKEYDYDSANNRKLFVLKKNGTAISNISYTYDNQSRIKDVLNKGQVIATYTYDYNGNRDTLTYSNGNSVKYGYNLVNKITQLTNKKGLSILSDYSYTYNLDGNRAGESEATKAKNKAYEYDGLGRLTTETEDSQSAVNYDYDDNNNRNKMVMPGNFADFENSFKDTLYTYNGLNQLTNVTIGTVNAAYAYNGDGLRTSKTVNGTKTTHLLDGQNVAAEIDGQGSITEYIRGINLIASIQGTDIKFYLYNGHGDVVHLTDSDGNVIKNYEYDAFGNEKNIDTNDKNPFRYAGEYFDKETGFIYLRARYYDPKIGRFISEDSYWGKSNDPLSLNLYTYCSNSPVMFIDPSGHNEELDHEPGDADNFIIDANGQKYEGEYKEIEGFMCFSFKSIGDAESYFNSYKVKVSNRTEMQFAKVIKGSSGPWTLLISLYGDMKEQSSKETGKGELHHIASDKSLVSGFTAQYEKIFKNAGMNLQNDVNLIFLEDHSGAHTKVYKQYVLDYITNATKGLKGDAAKEALTKSLTDLKDQLIKNPKMPYKGGL